GRLAAALCRNGNLNREALGLRAPAKSRSADGRRRVPCGGSPDAGPLISWFFSPGRRASATARASVDQLVGRVDHGGAGASDAGCAAGPDVAAGPEAGDAGAAERLGQPLHPKLLIDQRRPSRRRLTEYQEVSGGRCSPTSIRSRRSRPAPT